MAGGVKGAVAAAAAMCQGMSGRPWLRSDACMFLFCAAETRAKPLDRYRNIGIMAHIDAGKVSRVDWQQHPGLSVTASSHIIQLMYLRASNHTKHMVQSAYRIPACVTVEA